MAPDNTHALQTEINEPVYLLTPQQWGEMLTPPISARRARRLCEEGRVAGAMRTGGQWAILSTTPDIRDLSYRRTPRRHPSPPAIGSLA